jgi:predicted MFS family arabinose efflux permease
VGRVLGSFVARFSSLEDVFRSRALRRLQFAWAGFYVSEWASFVALSVYAYRVAGAAAVGLLGVVRMFPSALGVLLGTALADRTQRERVLLAVQLTRAVTLGACAIVLGTGGPSAVVFLLASLTATVGAAYRPSHLAVVPILARTPQELVATNVSASTFEGLAVLVGPALAGILLTFAGTDVVLAVSAAVALWAAVQVAGLPPSPHVPAPGRGAIGDALAGARALAHEPNPRLVIGLFASQAFVRGILNVALVVAAFKLLNAGQSGVGFLNAAFGAGGLAGGLLGLGLVGLRRLARPFAAGLVMWGVPLALIAAWPHEIWALTCLAVVGAGNAILDVSGFTLIQRGIDDDVLARVFGVFEILVVIAVGTGSLLGSLLVDQLGSRLTLAIAGGFLTALAALSYNRLRRIDATSDVPQPELAVLTGLPRFRPLPVTTLERLACHLRSVDAAAGTDIVQQGDEGDLFYVIRSGTVQVVQGGRTVATLQRGDYFGEIALLRDVPRVATCQALTNAQLYTLERDRFVSAVSGHNTSATEAANITNQRLNELEELTTSAPPPVSASRQLS